MSAANLWLRALSPPGSDQPKLFAALIGWGLEGVLVALIAEAQMGPAKRASTLKTKVAGGLRGRVDNFLIIIHFQACQGCT